MANAHSTADLSSVYLSPQHLGNGNSRKEETTSTARNINEDEEVQQAPASGDSGHHHGHGNGLSWFTTGLFLVSDMAGGGLVALPTAMIQSGFWTGISLSVLMTLMFMYTSRALGMCYVILQRRWPVYRSHCRQPYAEIGGRACGPKLRMAVAICLDLNQFSTTTVYLLLSAKNIHDAIKTFFKLDISFCILLIVLALVLLPLTYLNSPVDFWGAAVVAVCTTSVAVILICIGAIWDFGICFEHRAMPEHHPTNYFLALGTLLFAYGGHPAFPTVQVDMRRPDEFHKSSFLAFGILFAMYTPVCILGFLTYGNSLRESVINSLQHTWIQQAVNLMIMLHLIVTILIINNPLNQKMEEVFRVPHAFGWKRVAVRTAMMALVLFVAETVPTFGPLLDLIGGSVLMLTSLAFPCLFYLYLSAAEQMAEERRSRFGKVDKLGNGNGLPSVETYTNKEVEEDNERASLRDVVERSNKFTLCVCCFIIAFGVLGGAAATFSAIRELTYTKFVLPCYFSAFFGDAKEPNTTSGHINCCGGNQSISVYSEPQSCSEPNLNFYD